MFTQPTEVSFVTEPALTDVKPIGAFKAVLVVSQSGERSSIVVDPDGLHLVAACNYLSVIVRPMRGSRNTSETQATGIVKVLNAARSINVDIVTRLRSGECLTVREKALLIALVGQDVAKGTQAAYLRSFIAFARFVVEVAAESLDAGLAADRYARATAEFFASFANAALAPSTGDGQREGLPDEAKAKFVGILEDRAACQGVWRNPYAALRDRTFMRTCLLEGHRRDELLNLRLGDIDFATGAYRIERRPDDVDDPRRYQPLVKGYSRKLMMLASTLEGIVELVDERSRLPYASSHDFAFTTVEGKPLSRGAVNKAFRTFREKHGFVGDGFCPHVLRHSWNDDFSAYAEEVGLDPERAMKARKRQMGWRSSETAATYTRRHDRGVADEVSLGMQAKFLKRVGRS